MPGLTPKHERFVAEYLIDLNATQAAIRAGYSARTASAQSHKLLKHPRVKAAISKRQTKAMSKAELSAGLVLQEIRRGLTFDVRKLFDEKGNHIPVKDLDDDTASMIVDWEVILKNAKAGDGVTDEVLKVRREPKYKYVEMAAKHFKLLTEVTEHRGLDDLVERLAAGRRRVAEAHGKRSG